MKKKKIYRTFSRSFSGFLQWFAFQLDCLSRFQIWKWPRWRIRTRKAPTITTPTQRTKSRWTTTRIGHPRIWSGKLSWRLSSRSKWPFFLQSPNFSLTGRLFSFIPLRSSKIFSFFSKLFSKLFQNFFQNFLKNFFFKTFFFLFFLSQVWFDRRVSLSLAVRTGQFSFTYLPCRDPFDSSVSDGSSPQHHHQHSPEQRERNRCGVPRARGGIRTSCVFLPSQGLLCFFLSVKLVENLFFFFFWSSWAAHLQTRRHGRHIRVQFWPVTLPGKTSPSARRLFHVCRVRVKSLGFLPFIFWVTNSGTFRGGTRGPWPPRQIEGEGRKANTPPFDNLFLNFFQKA